ncbi:MAG: acyl-CoA synthase [Luteitalea sp.]|nr:acyl-CoA synthase [Luteitalea sp.]
MSQLDVSQLDFARLSPGDFARLVKETPKTELTEAMSGELRGRVLDEIFTRMTEQFLPEKAGSKRAVVHWRITGRPDGDQDEYELVIADATCTVNTPPQHEPRVTITLDAVEFLRLVSGNASSTTMFFTRKLTLNGDLGLGSGLISMFDIPKP